MPSRRSTSVVTDEMGEFEMCATVRVETVLHVRFPYRAPHPDIADFEALAGALDHRIEANHGDIPDDVKVDWVAISSETEPWFGRDRREART